MTQISLASYAFIDEDDVRRYLKLAEKVEGDIFTLLINAAVDTVERHVHRNILARSITEYLDGDGTRILHLAHFPIQSVTSLEFLNEDESVRQTVADYWIKSDEGQVWLKSWEGTAPRWTHSVKVVYSGGWTTGTIPSQIRLAGLMLVAKWFRDHDKQRDDITSTNIGGQVVTFANDPLPRKVEALLEPYRNFQGAA